MVARILHRPIFIGGCSTIHRAMKSTYAYSNATQKIFDDNKFLAKEHADWKERVLDISEPTEENVAEVTKKVVKLNAKPSPLSYEEFKQQKRISFQEYSKLHQDRHTPANIEKGYECYCRGGYASYLIELEQINPGIIF